MTTYCHIVSMLSNSSRDWPEVLSPRPARSTPHNRAWDSRGRRLELVLEAGDDGLRGLLIATGARRNLDRFDLA